MWNEDISARGYVGIGIGREKNCLGDWDHGRVGELGLW